MITVVLPAWLHWLIVAVLIASIPETMRKSFIALAGLWWAIQAWRLNRWVAKRRRAA